MSTQITDIERSEVPRQGILGVWDSIVGPSMSATELWLFLVPTLLATIAVPLYAVWKDLRWNLVQLIIAAVVTFDIVGGAIVNATPTTKGWYYKTELGLKNHFLFVAMHLHPLVVAWLYPGGKWTYFVAVYSYLILATAIILLSPLFLQASVSIVMYTGGILLSTYALAPIPGWEWFIPVYFLKLLISYLSNPRTYLAHLPLNQNKIH